MVGANSSVGCDSTGIIAGARGDHAGAQDGEVSENFSAPGGGRFQASTTPPQEAPAGRNHRSS